MVEKLSYQNVVLKINALMTTAAASGEYPSGRGCRAVGSHGTEGKKRSDETEEIPLAQRLLIGKR